MIRRIAVVLLAFALCLGCAQSGKQPQTDAGSTSGTEKENRMKTTADKLRELGFDVKENPSLKGAFGGNSGFEAYMLLAELGMGDYDYESGEWTPTSDQVYAFDAEVFDIEHMYALFLKGIQSIVPDIEITDVKEDLSGMTEEMSTSEESGEMTDGTRGISFLCNGHPYAIELTSYGDWMNPEIIDFMNDMLEKENCPKQLHLLPAMDQIAVLVYCTEEQSAALDALIFG